MIPLNEWTARPRPTGQTLEGTHIRLERFEAGTHGEALWRAFGGAAANRLIHHFGWPVLHEWTDLAGIIDGFNASGDFVTYAFCEPETGTAIGMASYLRIVEAHGVIETGAIAHGAKLARTPAATEAHYLMARHVFEDLGYRRYEWKLNDPNTASHAAARRLGFTHEGVFRQHMVMPYGNRDTAWYAMLDHEWPRARQALESWLAPDNFTADGRQKKRLEEIREGLS